MKIVILSIWYSEGMGYSENCLPKSLAKLGHEVHVITSVCQVYYNQPFYNSVYLDYLGEAILNSGTKAIDGFTLHRLPFGTFFGKIYLKHFRRKLNEIKPDVVQTFDTFSFLTLQTTIHKFDLGFKLFTASNVVASVFPLEQDKKNSLTYKLFNYFIRYIPGRFISYATTRCYPATYDAIEIAVKYLGVPREKTQLACLGVDTDEFKPKSNTSDELTEISIKRKKLGFGDDSIICIYTGRFTVDKNPLILAQAIDKLTGEGYKFVGLFLGEGPQYDSIRKMKGCVVHKFVPYHKLPDYYLLADVGIWPQQESTSMLDASAAGLPIIISDRVQATERIEGNGLIYKQFDVNSLIETLKKLTDKELRIKLGLAGTKKIAENFSWDKIAADRLNDYNIFLNGTN
jgi:glycosyltransferase involved in cell wall biosynthesis